LEYWNCNVVFSWYLFKQILDDKNIGSWGLIFIVLIIFCTGMAFIVIPFKNTRIGNTILISLGWILSLITKTIDFSQIVLIPLFSFISILALQLGIWKLINLFYTFNNQSLVSIYFLALITLLIFAYKGSQLITLFFKLFSSFRLTSSDKSKIKLVNKALEVAFFRRRAYEFSIVVMIISSIGEFTNTSLINNLLWINYSEVSLEVLVAFVAIDTYLQTFVKKSEVLESIR